MRIGTPHGRWPPRRTFLAACLLSVLTGCTFTFLMSTHAAAHDSSKVLLSANRVERLVVDMETGQLGFVATGDRRSLTPWLAARAAFPGEAARLQRLAEETGASQGARAREIVRAADAYLREHSAPLVDAAQRDLRKARSLIARGEGRRRIDAIRGQFDRFTEVQHQISSARERDAVPATRRMIAMAAGTSGSLLVVLLLVGLVTRTGIRRPPPPARAGEPEALRRAATLVARGGPLEETLRAVADEARRLLGEDHVTIGRYDPDGGMTILTRPSTRESPPTPGRRAIEDGAAEAVVLRTRRTAWTSGGGSARRVVACPVIVAGRLWGVMSFLSRTHGPPDEEARRCMEEFAGLAAIAVANDAERAGFTASRVRLVDASDATRRGIERDLHDRTQQHLVSVGMRLRAAEAALPPGQDALRERLSSATRDLTAIGENLQRIARDLYPVILDKGGLAASLRALTRQSPVPALLDVRARGELSERVAVTVHQVVSEALSNAGRHAHASIVRVSVEAGPALARVVVTDDGVGGADPALDSGLARLRDRVEALGGNFSVESPPGGGTTLRVSVPD